MRIFLEILRIHNWFNYFVQNSDVTLLYDNNRQFDKICRNLDYIQIYISTLHFGDYRLTADKPSE